MNGQVHSGKNSEAPRRGVFILPHLLTAANLFFGFYALLAAFHQDFHRAAIAIVASFLLDGLDGRIARATRTTSHFGIEFDSLSDLVAFGVAPAMLIFSWALTSTGRLGWLAAFLYMACGALRLARFNVQSYKTSLNYFRGLPIPAAAGLIATIVLFCPEVGWGHGPPKGLMVATLYALSFLMVSNIPYKGFKDADFVRRKPFQSLVVSVLLLVVILIYPPITLFVLAFAYVISGPLGLLRGFKRVAVPEERAEEIQSH